MPIDNNYSESKEALASTSRQWRYVVGSGNSFEVSDKGDIRKVSTGKTVKQTPDHNGRLCCGVMHNDMRKIRKVHIMVAEAFIGIRPNGYKIKLLDGNKNNCSIRNIVYISPEDHQKDRRLDKTVAPSAKLNPEKVIEIRKLIEGGTRFAIIAEKYDISYGSIKKISSRLTWNHI